MPSTAKAHPVSMVTAPSSKHGDGSTIRQRHCLMKKHRTTCLNGYLSIVLLSGDKSTHCLPPRTRHLPSLSICRCDDENGVGVGDGASPQREGQAAAAAVGCCAEGPSAGSLGQTVKTLLPPYPRGHVASPLSPPGGSPVLLHHRGGSPVPLQRRGGSSHHHHPGGAFSAAAARGRVASKLLLQPQEIPSPLPFRHPAAAAPLNAAHHQWCWYHP